MWKWLKGIDSGFMEGCLEDLFLEQLVIGIFFSLKKYDVTFWKADPVFARG